MAFSFKDAGATDAISYTDIAALDSLTTFSIACTIKLDTIGVLGVIASKFAALQGWQLSVLTTGKLQLKIGNGSTSAVATSTTVLAANTVYRIVVTYNGTTDKVIFYINTVAEAAKAISNLTIGNSTAVVTWGNSPSGSNALDGDLENALIWSSVLTQSEAQTYTVGGRIAPNSALQFFQPCWSNAQRDLVSGAARTVTGTVNEVESFSNLPFVVRPHFGRLQATVIVKLIKVINETEGIVEGKLDILGLIKVINETEGIVEGSLNRLGILKIINETVNVLDGDNNDLFDPAGKMTEIMSGGTVWTTVWPPFTKRTKWTNA